MNPRRIMIVEDEAIVATDLEGVLEDLNYEVCNISSSGEVAVENALKLLPDLILMDIKLSGPMDGIEAAEKILQTRELPIVYLTAHADDLTLERALKTLPYGYILKPFEEIELRVALKLALEKFKTTKMLELSSVEIKEAEVPETALLEKISSSLLKVEPFCRIPSEKILQVSRVCRSQKVAAGDLFAFEGEPGDSGVLVLSGRVVMLKTSPSGRELIVEQLEPKDIFGIAVALEQKSLSFTIRAQVDSEILFVPQSVILNLLGEFPEIYRSFIEVMSSRLKASYDFSRSLAHDKVNKRVAMTLRALLPRNSSGESNNELAIHITRQELADLVGTTVETAIRITRDLERLGILDLRQSGLIRVIDVDGLNLGLNS